jgi:hypothetical protein
MPRNFVLAFGGTGARCAEAFTYLLASRVVTEPCHVLIIDPDQSNGNVATAREQLQRYLALHKTLTASADAASATTTPFFATPVNESPESFYWANANDERSWRSTVGYDLLDDASRELLELLYDESDMELTFDQGYVGRAHIGSLDLSRVLEEGMLDAAEQRDRTGRDALQQFFQQLRAATQQQGANLVVIGSIFGGTGASGLPAVPKALRSTLDDLRARVTLSCVLVAPYFSFPQGKEGAPDTAVHPLAAQTAMRHYALNDAGYDRIYVLGAPKSSKTADENAIGGELQKNRAHHVELSAALAAAHAFRTGTGSAGRVDQPTELYMTGARELTWDTLPATFAGPGVRRQLVALAAFCVFHAHWFVHDLARRHHTEWVWGRKTMLGKRPGRELLGREKELSNDLDAFAKRYLQWIRDVQQLSEDERVLFTLDAALGDDSAARLTSGGDHLPDQYDQALKYLNTSDNQQQGAVGYYLHSLTDAAYKFCDVAYRSWNRGAER